MKLLFILIFPLITWSSVEKLQLVKMNNSSKNCEFSAHQKNYLFYWATWCSTCKSKLQKTLPKIQTDFPDANIITVNLDIDKKRAEAYLKKHKINDVSVCYERNKYLEKEHGIATAPYSVFYQKAHFQAEKGFSLSKIEKFFQ